MSVDFLKEESTHLRRRLETMHKERDAALQESSHWLWVATKTKNERDSALAEVERLRAERDEARKWLEGICTEFESTIAHAEWRASGSKGMSVPFFGDFADAARHPGMIGRMGWWVRQFRAVLKEGDQ